MSQQQQRDAIDQKGTNQVLHIRSDSETKLDELFNAVIHPKDHQVPLTVPMRLRNLPPSFFKQPDKGSRSASHSRESSSDNTNYNGGGGGAGSPQGTSGGGGGASGGVGLQINHPRAHSSPATLQQAYNNNTSQHQHLRQQSYDIVDDRTPLPPGWEMAKTSSGQIYFLNHLTQTTTWDDPRKKTSAATSPVAANGAGAAAAAAPNLNQAALGPLPKGWEQATTMEGEIYFINHIDRTTSWLDPRIPAHLQNPPVIQTPSINAQRQPTGNHIGQLPVQSIALAASLAQMKSAASSGQITSQQRQQQLRLHRLQMERERLRMRQQEIIRQNACLGNPLANQELLLRESVTEELTIPTSLSSSDLQVSSSLESFLDGVTDFHSRQESADSGLGLGSTYSLPHTPEDFLSNLDDVEDCQSNDLSLDLQSSLDLGDENMDSDDLVPSLQEELNADILSDVEAILTSNKDSMLTWL